MTLRKATQEEIQFTKKCRRAVKDANFALLYGAGTKTLKSSLMSSDPSLSDKEATALAKKLLEQKKGKKDENGYFYGGSDSGIYNALLDVAFSSYSELPVLGTKISMALRRNAVGNDFITARTNYPIQALGTEMLATIITIISALIKKYKIDADYVMSVHDELVFMVNDNCVDRFCEILQTAHYLSWRLFHEKFGIDEFPWARAFFSSVEVRKCYTKEANESVVTISNPQEIPMGKSITIKDMKNMGLCV